MELTVRICVSLKWKQEGMIKARSRFMHMLGQDKEDQFGQELGRGTRSEPETCGNLDHFVILLPDEVPVDRTPEDQLEVGVLFRIACFHQRELLPMDALEAGKEPKTQERAHRKGDFGLPMGINIVAIDSHVG